MSRLPSGYNVALEVDPQTVAEYLISRGWTAQETIGDKATIWEDESGESEIWLPLRRDLRDYTKLMTETFETLEIVEDRSINAIIQDLSLSDADMTRIRLDNGVFTNTLPLSGGINAITRARDIIVAASRSIVDPRPVYFFRPTGKVSQFLRRLRLGQTEVGSYIITIISPLIGDDRQFSRDSIARTFSAVQRAREASVIAIQHSSMAPFDDLTDMGVNANLCDALVGLGESSNDGAVELKFTWSRQIARSTTLEQMVTIDSSLLKVLRVAADYLRTSQPLVDVELLGTVKDISDRSAEDVQSEVTLLADVFGTQRSIHFTLQGSDRTRAIAAFHSRLPILVRGTLNQSTFPVTMVDIRFVREIGEGFRSSDESEFGEDRIDLAERSLRDDKDEPLGF
jgi:hypothetical protein